MGKGKGGGKGGKGGKGKGGKSKPFTGYRWRKPRSWRGSSWHHQGDYDSGQDAQTDWTLVDRIKDYQRVPEGKAAWEMFCDLNTNGRYDPSRTSPALLAKFLEQFEAPGEGGGEDEDSEARLPAWRGHPDSFIVYTRRDDGNHHYITHNELQVATGDFIHKWGWSPFTAAQTLQLFDLCQQERQESLGTSGLLIRRGTAVEAKEHSFSTFPPQHDTEGNWLRPTGGRSWEAADGNLVGNAHQLPTSAGWTLPPFEGDELPPAAADTPPEVATSEIGASAASSSSGVATDSQAYYYDTEWSYYHNSEVATEIVAQFFNYDYGVIHPWESMLARDRPYNVKWDGRKLHSWDEILEAGAGEEGDPEVPKSYSCLCCGKTYCGNQTTPAENQLWSHYSGKGAHELTIPAEDRVHPTANCWAQITGLVKIALQERDHKQKRPSKRPPNHDYDPGAASSKAARSRRARSRSAPKVTPTDGEPTRRPETPERSRSRSSPDQDRSPPLETRVLTPGTVLSTGRRTRSASRERRAGKR